MVPLVSILIPVFNAQRWIADTLRSAIAQTWQRKEIIVVDDGSTDQTLAVARKFESDSVRVITQRNQGAPAARNRAFSLSQGSYIQWLDADDLLAPDKIARQTKVLDQNAGKRTLVSSSWTRFFYRHYGVEFSPDALWCDLSPTEFLLRKMGQNLFMPNASWLVSRELTEATGPWNTSLATDDDGEYFCRVLLASDGIRFVPEARVYYRVSGTGSVSYISGSNSKLECQWRSMQLHIGYLRSLEDSERTRAACVQYLKNWLIFFYPERLDIVEQAANVAKDLGGQLGVPQLSWKYSWIQASLGWDLAKRAQVLLPNIRWSLVRYWDKALFRMESPKSAGNLRK